LLTELNGSHFTEIENFEFKSRFSIPTTLRVS
jgi:hypothetical protein